MNNTKKKPSKQELEALNKVVDFNKESNDSKKDVIYTPAKDENLETEFSIEKIKARIRENNKNSLVWVDNQFSGFLDTEPPKDNGLCITENGGLDIPRRETVVITAPGGTGKSYFAFELALGLSSGLEIFNYTPKRPYKILYLFGEDPLSVIHQRAQNISIAYPKFKDADKLYQINKNLNVIPVRNMPLSTLKNGIQDIALTESWELVKEALAREKAKNSPIDILILDPLARFYGLRENSNEDATFFLNETLGYFQHELGFGITTIVIAHVAKGDQKQKGLDDLENVTARGAKSFIDSCRYHITLAKPTLEFVEKEGKKYGLTKENYKKYVMMKPIKVNFGKDDLPLVFLKKNSNGVLLMKDPKAETNLDAEELIYNWIYSYYNDDCFDVEIDNKKYKVEPGIIELPPKEQRDPITKNELSCKNKSDIDKKNTGEKEYKKKALYYFFALIQNKVGNLSQEIPLRLKNLEERKLIKKEIDKNSQRENIFLTGNGWKAVGK